ncbi:recombinase family protein [Albibacillus kandeliae]|uniref:recombinase family protein n=1 Tax=Albibacillus kandeliae TaxID=2174228 RepID=UPI000D686D91|nr:recombinase family protein [Albibacillus kandeliae]
MAPAKVRCAIYTRKSSEEGLDQEFNSLDAQYEACTAYVASQKHEGLVLCRDRFDDGGKSGGTLERPALQRLLAEVSAGRIGMIVVNTIDRLTRSLADFAKLVERFETTGCSFVSVTQAFNTASSMGRLTLNVLLSFAQFEREVTAERIRDKIAASKQQGLWMGGIPPLGYDPHPDPKVRELVANESEALTVRTLFELYEQHGSLARLEEAAASLGLRSKVHRFRSGRCQGGGSLSRGQIHKILLNPVYLGQIRHKEKCWPGRHSAVLDEALWNRVQEKLQSSPGRRRGQATGAITSPLTGKLRDETGDRLTPTHTVKAGQRHPYYVSNRLISGGPDPTGWRLPGLKFEALVASIIADHIAAALAEHRLLSTPDLRRAKEFGITARSLVQALSNRDPNILQSLLLSGTVSPREIGLTLDRVALARRLQLAADDLAPDVTTIALPISLRRRGVEQKLVLATPEPAPDHTLIRTLASAHDWAAALRQGAPLSNVARDAGHHGAFIRTRGQLAFLSPKIQRAIRDGRLPPEITLKRFMAQPIPLDWDAQEKRLGV